MRPWNGVETADIVYPDTSSSLTSILVDAGYLDEEWVGTHPTYYVEVKTTTGECDGAFFMSRAQYRRVCIQCSMFCFERSLLTLYIDGKNAFTATWPGQCRYLFDFPGSPSWEAEYGSASIC